MSQTNHLMPFLRGTTYGDGQLTLTDATAEKLKGMVFETTDDLHGTGNSVMLRVVQNDSGSALTIARIGKCVPFTTSNVSFGKRASATLAGAGVVAKPIDDYYTEKGVSEIPANDLYYVVEEGPCDLMGDASHSLDSDAVGTPVSVSGSGLIDSSEDGHFVVGATMEQADTSATTSIQCYVRPGIIKIGAT